MAASETHGAGGVRRKVDHLGRIVIPASMRRVLGITDGDELEVRLDGAEVLLRKPRVRCTFCGSTTELRELLGQPVCWSCAAAVAAMGSEGHEPGSGPADDAPS